MANLKSKFTAGSSVFTCQECGRRTRNTGRGEIDGEYCWECVKILETDNSHIDGDHNETPDPNCRMCRGENG